MHHAVQSLTEVDAPYYYTDERNLPTSVRDSRLRHHPKYRCEHRLHLEADPRTKRKSRRDSDRAAGTTGDISIFR